MRTLIAILALVPFLAGAATPGCTEAGADVPAALAAAQASPARCLSIPAGVYAIPAGLLINVPNVTITGAGMGATILETTMPAPTLPLYAVRITGAGATLSDLTIRGAQSATSGVKVEASGATLMRIEVTGAFSAAGIETYAPASTPTQGATITGNTLHDLRGNGLLIDSSGNTITGNTLARVGVSSLYHGLYVQGGDNLIAGNTIRNASGYSLHGWHYVPGMDGSGNRYLDNLSIDPGVGHMAIGGNTRSATIRGNTFRSTGGSQAAGIDARTPVLITENTFEDVSKAGAAIIALTQAATGSVVSDNRITAPNPYPGYGARFGILLEVPALITGNTLDIAELPWGIVARVGKGQIIANRITSAQGYGWQTAIKIDAPDMTVSLNTIDIPAGIGIGGSVAPARATDNLVWGVPQ